MKRDLPTQVCLCWLFVSLGVLSVVTGCRRSPEAPEEAKPQTQKTAVVENVREHMDRALSELEAARIDGVIDGRQFAKLSRIGQLNAVYRLTPNQFLELLASEGITYEDQKNLFNMITRYYCFAKARVDPVGLARDFKNTTSISLSDQLADGLGAYAPELAVETIQEMPNFDEDSKHFLLKSALFSAAGKDMEKAIHVFESIEGSLIEKESLAISVVSGVDAEMIGNQGGVQRVKEIVGTFSADSLAAYPAAISSLAKHVAFRPLDEVLEVFPIDGEPWQRMGAMTYLKAFAPVGTPGSEKIGQFLDSDQAVHLTPVERAELEKLRGGFFPTP
jgi:hypothetical protein